MAKKMTKGEAITAAISQGNSYIAGVSRTQKKTVKKGKDNGRKRSK